MATVTKSINIGASVERVFAYISEPMNTPEWISSVVEVTDVTGSGVGQHYRWRYNMAGVPLKGRPRSPSKSPMSAESQRAKVVLSALGLSPLSLTMAARSSPSISSTPSRFPC